MAKEKVPLNTLSEYLPANAFEPVEVLLITHRVQLTVTRSRSTILGDYRPANGNKGHRISVNGNLNPYGFLVTLLHELGHLTAFLEHGSKIAPHGPEWKRHFSSLLDTFLKRSIFPADVQDALEKTLQNPAASSCGDLNLMRVLDRYNPPRPDQKRVESLELGATFQTKDGRLFERGEKRRTRYLCRQLDTQQLFLFHALFPVREIQAMPGE